MCNEITIQEIDCALLKGGDIFPLHGQIVRVNKNETVQGGYATYGSSKNLIFLFLRNDSMNPIIFQRIKEDGTIVEGEVRENTFWVKI